MIPSSHLRKMKVFRGPVATQNADFWTPLNSPETSAMLGTFGVNLGDLLVQFVVFVLLDNTMEE